MRSPRSLVALAATVALLGACSSDVPEVQDLAAPTATPSPSSTPTPTATPSPAASPSAEPTEVEPCPAGQQRVAPGGACFEPAPAPEPEPEPEPTAEPAPEPEPEPAPATDPCDGRDRRNVDVTAVNFAFSVETIGDLCRGDTITLEVREGSHSFTARSAGADTGVFGASDGPMTVTVDAAPGTYNFVCVLHGQMNGELTVIG